MTDDGKTRTDPVGDILSGTHMCEFYGTSQELAETLVPYFAAGLRQNELCMWVTADSLGVEEAKAELRKMVPSLERYLEIGQIEIVDYRDWYLKGGNFDADRVL